ncbi:hypothetical protein AB3I13_04545 [Enterococcus sp. C62]|uniref:hypothetical protein n=1 Tax=Enterococcus TaxID=1350 RepID=UPI0009C13266|nr:hypothetical protein [Enterococcus hirae]EMF0076187.1 hypothetical protein [Enterococcus hirae]EMF0102579.1 hypothetical protein [Enterococcus hirae]EMF0131147.1 hypothetical protein [Enterococcus hirae]EMF0478848.1 hypothetical protein [Enterococcus hirae]EMF0517419.1 hypothetical protein [Enterococcus hirae]
MSEFKQKMERQLAEEKKAKIQRKINDYESDIKVLEKIGNTENTFLKLSKFFFSGERGFKEFYYFIAVSQFVVFLLFPYIHSVFFTEVLVFSLILLGLIVLTYWNVSIKRLNKYLNKLIYKELQELEFALEGVKEQLRRETDKQRGNKRKVM